MIHRIIFCILTKMEDGEKGRVDVIPSLMSQTSKFLILKQLILASVKQSKIEQFMRSNVSMAQLLKVATNSFSCVVQQLPSNPLY